MALFGRKKAVVERMDFQTFKAKYNKIAHGAEVIIEEPSDEYYTLATFKKELDETTYRYACNVTGEVQEVNGMLSAKCYKL
ncbi:MAG: hypothetical protein K6D02_05320 [Lachnospiraceae bacterium]|nr:hypothetical protein [Lachnospiraceae bacterium]